MTTNGTSSKIYYLVYNIITLKLLGKFAWYGSEIHNCIEANENSSWINITHPRYRELLAEINSINKTTY